MMATTMSANVLMVIIPGQRKVVAALRAGEPVDPVHGQRGKQRSVHNTYFTLPVLFTMMSNHYGFLYAAQAQLARAGGADARRRADPHCRSCCATRRSPKAGRCRGSGRSSARWCVAVTVIWLQPAPHRRGAPPRRRRRRPSPQVQAIVAERCQMCHNAAMPSKNVRLDSPEAIAHARAAGLPADRWC